MTLSPSLAEVFERVIGSKLADLHTFLPGTVVSYDRSTQTARVRPAIRQAVPSFDNEEIDVHETLPDIPQVPCVWPGGGASFLTCDLNPGDSVILCCADSDWSAWWRSGKAGNAEDGLRHDLSHAICIPGLRAKPQAIQGLVGPLLQLSATPTPTDSIARASKLDDFCRSVASLPPVVVTGTPADEAALMAAANGIIAAARALVAEGSVGSVRTRVDQ